MNACPTCTMQFLDEVVVCPRDGAVLGSPVLEGRYRLLSRIGEGGMGLVYLGEHLALRKKVAVKVLRGEIAHDPQLSARFQQEAIAASQIGHEHIVAVTDFGHLPDGALFYVMEHLEGETLARALDRQRPMALPRALTLLSQIASAIGAAHERGIVHRDLKPQNVMVVTRDGVERAKVLDFGISKVNLRDPDAQPITEQGAVLGTAEYMAPEQAAGDVVDPRTDIYALGVMAYELVTGTLPFRGEHTIATILKQLNERPQPPAQRAPWLNLPPRLDALIMRCLAKNPAERPDTMANVRAELLALQRELGLPQEQPASRPIPLVEEVSSTGTRSEAFSSAGAPSEPFARTVSSRRPPTPPKRWVAMSAVAVAVTAAILGGASWLALREVEPSAGVETNVSNDGAPLARDTDSAGATAEAAPGDPAVVSAAKDTADAGDPAPAVTAPAPEVDASPRLTLRTIPPGATVQLGRTVLGRTPLSIARPPENAPPLRLSLSGYVTRELRSLPDSESVEVRLRRSRRTSTRPPSDEPDEEFERVDDLKVPFP